MLLYHVYYVNVADNNDEVCPENILPFYNKRRKSRLTKDNGTSVSLKEIPVDTLITVTFSFFQNNLQCRLTRESSRCMYLPKPSARGRM